MAAHRREGVVAREQEREGVAARREGVATCRCSEGRRECGREGDGVPGVRRLAWRSGQRWPRRGEPPQRPLRSDWTPRRGLGDAVTSLLPRGSSGAQAKAPGSLAGQCSRGSGGGRRHFLGGTSEPRHGPPGSPRRPAHRRLRGWAEGIRTTTDPEGASCTRRRVPWAPRPGYTAHSKRRLAPVDRAYQLDGPRPGKSTMRQKLRVGARNTHAAPTGTVPF